MSFSKILLFLVPAGLIAGAARAHNNYFLPGDAFFSVTLTRGVIAEWTKNTEPDFEFPCTRFDGQFMACGNMGYSRIRIKGIDGSFRWALAEAFARYEERPVGLNSLAVTVGEAR